MENNNNAPPAPANPAPVPVQEQGRPQGQPRPPARTGLTKARDTLLSRERVITFGTQTRCEARVIPIDIAYFDFIVTLYTMAFTAMWNQGFSSITPGGTVNNMANYCTQYAVCYVHHIIQEAYSSIRDIAKAEATNVFTACYADPMSRTGFQFDPFARKIFNLIHPALCNRGLEESLYFIDFDYNLNRDHSNWFNLNNVDPGSISIERMIAITDTLSRSKQVNLGAMQFGIKRGSTAMLLDFYPRGEDVNREYAVSWLNKDNNYTDDDLAIMYIVGRDISAHRLGPHFCIDPTPTEQDRDNSIPPFFAEYIECEDTDAHGLNAFHVDVNGNRVDTYAQAAAQEAEWVRMYSRSWYFYRKKVLQSINLRNQQIAFKQVFHG